MNKLAIILTTVLVLLGAATRPAQAGALRQAADPTFVIQVFPQDPYPGQEVVVTVQVQDYHQNKETLGVVEAQVNGIVNSATGATPAATLEWDDQGIASFKFFTPAETKTYHIQVVLTDSAGEELARQVFMLKVETALPDSIVQVFAGLGLFAAVMAIMATGTEVVIELVKSLFGFKSKPTALEALDQLKSELPGAIAGLGVDAKRAQELNHLITGVETTIQPLENVATAIAALKAGDFMEVFNKVDEMSKARTDAIFKQAQAEALHALDAGLAVLYKKIPQAEGFVAPVAEKIRETIAVTEKRKVAELMSNFGEQMVGLRDAIAQNGAAVTTAWLRSQVDIYLKSGRGEVDRLKDELIKSLRGLGFSDDHLSQLEEGLTDKLDQLESLTHDKVSVYALSVQNLLQALEDRRNIIQSPGRSLWRVLRDSRLPLWGAYLIILSVLLVAALGYGMWQAGRSGAAAPWYPMLLVGIAWLVAAFLSGIAAIFPPWKQIPNRPEYLTVGWRWVFKIRFGDFLRYVVEVVFNFLIGHKATFAAAHNYGQIDAEIQKQINGVNPTTLAGSLLSLETIHQNQEKWRVQLIRILSILVGTYLAYLLQIDAASYLNYAIPGIEAKINFVHPHTLLRFIPAKLTVGIILTGLAASAGSKFWRDMLTRLQEARGQAEEAARVVKKVKELLPTAEK